MATNFLPLREAELIGFSDNFKDQITATPVRFGLTAAQATAYGALNDTFAAAYNVLQNPVTKSPSNVEAKNAAKEALIDGPGGIRELANLAQAYPAITDQSLIDLRLTVRDVEPTPVPIPASAPGLAILDNTGRTVTLRLFDPEETESRAKPEGVKGATLFTFVGDEAPAIIEDWQFNQSTTKPNRVVVTFPASVPDGAKVWLAAFWFNPTSQSGPLSEPVSTRIIGGLSMAA